MSYNAAHALSNLFNVQDRVAVVTGGATGIGLTAAQALANNGARVYIVGRRKDALETAVRAHSKDLAHPAGRLIALQADITSKDSIAALASELGAREKHIDVLVNNAGVSQGSSTVEKGDESAKALAQELWSEELSDWEDVHARTGAIINISSISGLTRTTQHHYKYNVSKAAAVQLNTLLAQELRRSGVQVRVNSIAPGIFPSEMTTDGSDAANKSHIAEDHAEWGAKKGIPAGRPGRDADIAQAVLFFACNEYVYGQTIAVDGGYLLEHP